MRWVLRLGVLLAAVVLGRELWSRQLQLTAASGDLDHQRADIDAAETEIDALDGAIDESETRLRDLDYQIGAIERQHPTGIPQSVYPAYAQLVADQNEAVARHNELVARQHALHGEYKLQVDRHNARVAAANSFARDSGPCAMLPEWARLGACRDGD
jgi:hypothetical protein